MYDMDRLKAEITRLFYARMDRGGHTPEEIRQYLGGLDFQALTQTVRDRARTVYAYTTQGRHEKSFNYRGEELFGQRAMQTHPFPAQLLLYLGGRSWHIPSNLYGGGTNIRLPPKVRNLLRPPPTISRAGRFL